MRKAAVLAFVVAALAAAPSAFAGGTTLPPGHHPAAGHRRLVGKGPAPPGALSPAGPDDEPEALGRGLVGGLGLLLLGPRTLSADPRPYGIVNSSRFRQSRNTRFSKTVIAVAAPPD
jgi:hypothetical protein